MSEWTNTQSMYASSKDYYKEKAEFFAKENAALRAQIEAARKQDNIPSYCGVGGVGRIVRLSSPLYTHQPIPDGCQLVPVEPTFKMLDEIVGNDFSYTGLKARYKAMLKVAKETT